ncbi:MAG: rod-binding protein [Desulfovibrionaceae bacterium]
MAPEAIGMNASLATASAKAEMNRFTQSMTDLKQRLAATGGEAGQEKQLRKACKDFEAVFIGKMWQEMQKTVPKEGYLHGQQEEMYNSMFEQAMSEHLSEAGGIGLADMLYDQLASRLKTTSQTTLPGNASLDAAGQESNLAAYRSGAAEAEAPHALDGEKGMAIERPQPGGRLGRAAGTAQAGAADAAERDAQDAQAAQLSVQMRSAGEEWVNVDSLEEGDGAS